MCLCVCTCVFGFFFKWYPYVCVGGGVVRVGRCDMGVGVSGGRGVAVDKDV